jgi:hypothetical protein
LNCVRKRLLSLSKCAVNFFPISLKRYLSLLRIFYFLWAIIPDLFAIEADQTAAQDIKYELRKTLDKWFEYARRKNVDILAHYLAQQEFYQRLDAVQKNFQPPNDLEDIIYLPNEQ